MNKSYLNLDKPYLNSRHFPDKLDKADRDSRDYQSHKLS